MKPSNIKKMQELFIGRVCTILTITVAKVNFHDTQFSDFFTGIVEAIDEDGILMKHHLSGCKNFYFMPHIVSILEEQVIEEDNPQYEKIIEKIRKAPAEQKENIVEVNPNASPYIDPELLALLQKQSNETSQKTMLNKK
jgi:hypothetical protein